MACREWERTPGATWMHEEPDEATESDPALLDLFRIRDGTAVPDTAAERLTGYGDGDTAPPLFSNSKPVGNRRDKRVKDGFLSLDRADGVDVQRAHPRESTKRTTRSASGPIRAGERHSTDIEPARLTKRKRVQDTEVQR